MPNRIIALFRMYFFNQCIFHNEKKILGSKKEYFLLTLLFLETQEEMLAHNDIRSDILVADDVVIAMLGCNNSSVFLACFYRDVTCADSAHSAK